MASVLTEPTEIRHVHDLEAALALFGELGGLPYEAVAFAYLDPERRLLGLRHVRSGSVDAADVPVRLIVADALAFDASAVVMAHNHPGGDPTPSEADRAVTRRLARIFGGLEMPLLDHIILATNGMASFRALGLL